MDFGKTHIPAISLAIGASVKFVLNVFLVSNPSINIYGSPISSTVCQIINFSICAYCLNKYIKMKLNFIKHIFKPIFSACIMGMVAFDTQYFLSKIIGNARATIIAIFVGMITYAIMIIFTKTLEKDDFTRIPFGMKIYSILTKFKIYS